MGDDDFGHELAIKLNSIRAGNARARASRQTGFLANNLKQNLLKNSKKQTEYKVEDFIEIYERRPKPKRSTSEVVLESVHHFIDQNERQALIDKSNKIDTQRRSISSKSLSRKRLTFQQNNNSKDHNEINSKSSSNLSSPKRVKDPNQETAETPDRDQRALKSLLNSIRSKPKTNVHLSAIKNKTLASTKKQTEWQPEDFVQREKRVPSKVIKQLLSNDDDIDKIEVVQMDNEEEPLIEIVNLSKNKKIIEKDLDQIIEDAEDLMINKSKFKKNLSKMVSSSESESEEAPQKVDSIIQTDDVHRDDIKINRNELIKSLRETTNTSKNAFNESKKLQKSMNKSSYLEKIDQNVSKNIAPTSNSDIRIFKDVDKGDANGRLIAKASTKSLLPTPDMSSVVNLSDSIEHVQSPQQVQSTREPQRDSSIFAVPSIVDHIKKRKLSPSKHSTKKIRNSLDLLISNTIDTCKDPNEDILQDEEEIFSSQKSIFLKKTSIRNKTVASHNETIQLTQTFETQKLKTKNKKGARESNENEASIVSQNRTKGLKNKKSHQIFEETPVVVGKPKRGKATQETELIVTLPAREMSPQAQSDDETPIVATTKKPTRNKVKRVPVVSEPSFMIETPVVNAKNSKKKNKSRLITPESDEQQVETKQKTKEKSLRNENIETSSSIAHKTLKNKKKERVQASEQNSQQAEDAFEFRVTNEDTSSTKKSTNKTPLHLEKESNQQKEKKSQSKKKASANVTPASLATQKQTRKNGPKTPRFEAIEENHDQDKVDSGLRRSKRSKVQRKEHMKAVYKVEKIIDFTGKEVKVRTLTGYREVNQDLNNFRQNFADEIKKNIKKQGIKAAKNKSQPKKKVSKRSDADTSEDNHHESLVEHVNVDEENDQPPPLEDLDVFQPVQEQTHVQTPPTVQNRKKSPTPSPPVLNRKNSPSQVQNTLKLSSQPQLTQEQADINNNSSLAEKQIPIGEQENTYDRIMHNGSYDNASGYLSDSNASDSILNGKRLAIKFQSNKDKYDYKKIYDGVYAARLNRTEGVYRVDEKTISAEAEHDTMIAYWIQEGCVEFRIKNRKYLMQNGEKINIPKFKKYQIKNVSATCKAFLIFEFINASSK